MSSILIVVADLNYRVYVVAIDQPAGQSRAKVGFIRSMYQYIECTGTQMRKVKRTTYLVWRLTKKETARQRGSPGT